ncbi:MAG TPA: pantetheine-phosphate adenylyltransferase [Candidatus Binatia bacterium]|nr:pantetheine-phosphate adenylyltransferase [Candidatus Binatia bacterium]
MEETIGRGIVALSADPVTNGHLDIIARAAAKCRELVALVANNDRKLGSYAFTLDERTAMVERAVRERGIGNVRVVGSGGLLADVYLAEGCDRLFRGVRNEKDLDYEEEQAVLNRMILPSLEIEFLQADPALKLVSSTLVKAFVQLQLDVDKFAPMFVKQALEERLLGQYRVTVTGGIAVGKSWVASELARQAKAAGVEASHVNVDQLLREVYDEDSNGAQKVRDALAERFGGDILAAGGKTVDRKRLAECLFVSGNDGHRAFVTDLTMPHVARKYRAALAPLKGLVVVEWAQTAEMGMGSWTNGNVIVVDSPTREAFRVMRNIPKDRAEVMDQIQWPADRKAAMLAERAAAAKNGKVIRYANALRLDKAEAERDLAALVAQVRGLFPGLFEKK